MALDVSFIRTYYPLYVRAAALTLKLAGMGILFALVVGAVCSLVIYRRVPFLRSLAKGYVELSRNTPLLIQLFFLYYGLPRLGIRLSSETCAIIGISFLGGSYMAEAFRGGLESVSRPQIESGLSLGLSQRQIIRYVVAPQALSVAIPMLGANVLFLIKETSVVSAVALADLMFVAKDLIGMYYRTSEALTMLVVAYLVILLPLGMLLRYGERRLRHASYGS